MHYEQLIYRIGFVLEGRLPLELIFGGEFSQDLVVSVTLAVIKAKPHVRQVAVKHHSTFASTSKEKKGNSKKL